MNEAAWPALERAARADAAIVFVCSGNMVRSAFAELYAEHVGCSARVRSCATTFRNDGLYPDTLAALRARGVDEQRCADFRPTHLDELVPTLRGDEVFLAMRRHHLEAVEEVAPGRAFLLDAREIADPVLEGADFDATFAAVARCVDELVERLRESR